MTVNVDYDLSEDKNYRAYFFQNFYLQGIHAGIQSAHTVARMSVKYLEGSAESEFYKRKRRIYSDWADLYEVMIVLNGGMHSDLESLKNLFSNSNYWSSDEEKKHGNPYPWAYFVESKEALNCAITNVGIILPPKIYNYNKVSKILGDAESFSAYLDRYRKENNIDECTHIPLPVLPKLNDFEKELVGILSRCKLMN